MTAMIERHRVLGLVWFAVLGAPTAWIAHLAITYALVEPICSIGAPFGALLHLTTAAALLVSLAAGAAAWWAWSHPSELAEDPIARRRTRFLGAAGLVLSVLFALVIVAEALPVSLQDPCLGS